MIRSLRTETGTSATVSGSNAGGGFALAAADFINVPIPRSALTLIETPRTVSQRNCLGVLGLDRRHYLELWRDYRDAGGAVMSAGKLRLVEIEPLLAWLRSRRPATSVPTVVAHDAVDELAAELGMLAR